METPHGIPVRSARNRVIDLLGIGDTYPLTDLPVTVLPPKVTIRDTAQVRIEAAQAGVSYQLFDPAGAPQARAKGADAPLALTTPSVLENVTYRVRATKTPTRADLSPQGALTLEAPAPVKVGLDDSLVIRFKESPPLLLLDPSLIDPPPAAPRLVPYGTAVEVEVEASQEGVSYSLIIDGRELGNLERIGNRRTISLLTGALREDATLQVRATKTIYTDNQPIRETEPLRARLHIKVMADPGLAVAPAASLILDFGQESAIRISKSQASAQYRVWAAPVADADFVRGAAAAPADIVVPVADQADVRVRPLAMEPGWPLPAAFLPQGEAPRPGNGGDLLLPLPASSADMVLLVQAFKAHRADSDDAESRTIGSTLRLNQAVAILVRPDPARALVLRVETQGERTGSTLQVRGGEPGVYYRFQPLPAGDAVPLPAYFHKRDASDPAQNKGVGQLGLEIDFSIARRAAASPAQVGDDPATLHPLPPLLDITPLQDTTPLREGIRLAILALKAQTGVTAPMALEALIAAVPAIRAAEPVVDHGAAATILIPVSDARDLYQLHVAGQPVQPAVAGDGSDLVLETDRLLADARFEVVVTRAADAGVLVERVAPVPVLVRPDATLQVLARSTSVAPGSGTEIVVQASQRQVGYQLMSGATAVGAPVAGTGGDIALPTGPLAAQARFDITARRADEPQVTAVLRAQVTVAVTAP